MWSTRIGQAGRARPAVTVALGATRALIIASMAIVLGGLMALGMRIAPATTATRRLVPVAALVGGAAGLIALPVQTARVSGTGLSEVFHADAWTSALDTRAGMAWLVRVVVLVVVGVGASRSSTSDMSARSSGQVRSVGLGLGAALLGIASAYGGHGASGRWPVLGVATTAVHMTAMAIWLGGLVMLLVGLQAATARQIERFSGLALRAVAVVVVSGTVQAVRQVPNLGSVTSSDFGIALVWKLAAVSALLLAAVFSRQLVHGESLGLGVLARRMAPSAERVEHIVDLRMLRRSIGVEALIAAGVVVLTSVLMAADPSTAAQARPFSATLVDGEVTLSIFVTPGSVGNNEAHLALTSLSGALAQPDNVTLEVADPDRDVAGIGVELVDAGGTHLIAPRAEIPYAADWRFTVTARYGFEQYTFVATVPIG